MALRRGGAAAAQRVNSPRSSATVFRPARAVRVRVVFQSAMRWRSCATTSAGALATKRSLPSLPSHFLISTSMRPISLARRAFSASRSISPASGISTRSEPTTAAAAAGSSAPASIHCGASTRARKPICAANLADAGAIGGVAVGEQQRNRLAGRDVHFRADLADAAEHALEPFDLGRGRVIGDDLAAAARPRPLHQAALAGQRRACGATDLPDFLGDERNHRMQRAQHRSPAPPAGCGGWRPRRRRRRRSVPAWTAPGTSRSTRSRRTRTAPAPGGRNGSWRSAARPRPGSASGGSGSSARPRSPARRPVRVDRRRRVRRFISTKRAAFHSLLQNAL